MSEQTDSVKLHDDGLPYVRINRKSGPIRSGYGISSANERAASRRVCEARKLVVKARVREHT